MTDLIEKMARAIFGTQGMCHTDDERMFEPVKWEELDDDGYQCMRDGFRQSARAAITATGLTEAQLEGLANGTHVVISRQSLTEMHAALIACDEDGMTEHAECMVEAGTLVNRAMIAAKEG